MVQAEESSAKIIDGRVQPHPDVVAIIWPTRPPPNMDYMYNLLRVIWFYINPCPGPPPIPGKSKTLWYILELLDLLLVPIPYTSVGNYVKATIYVASPDVKDGGMFDNTNKH